MSQNWTTKDLEHWDARIREAAEAFGLSCFPQEFEVCDHSQMLGYMSYSGMPAHYPHWSYGKAYEKLKTLYDHGVSGLPYEMVINSNPSLAYLMRDNSLCLQILTIAHVYGHNDFFRNNFMFRDTHPEQTLANFKLRAERIRDYVEDPSIGADAVEQWLDAAHALSLQCRRHPAMRRLSQAQQQERALAAARPAADPFARIHKRPPYVEPDLTKVPLEPDQDVLLFIRDHNAHLGQWQRDLLTIVHEQAQYFVPQIETKIMNEGWASYWHHRIMHGLELPQDLHVEFLVHHNQVVRPHPGSLNPYHVGFKIWQDLHRRLEDPTAEELEEFGPPDRSGDQMIFQVRDVDRDASFLRRFLTHKLMRDLDMFEYGPKGEKLVVSKVSDQDNWQDVKHTLLTNVGMGSVPVIRVEDADYDHNRTLLVRHAHDGRDLHLEYAEKTLMYLHRLWGRPVVLQTELEGEPAHLVFDDDGFSRESP